MKKYFYIFCFIVLGVFLQQIIHTIVELFYIKLLISDFNKYGLGLSWDDWFMIHHVGGVILFLVGVIWGFFTGRRCWTWLKNRKVQ